MNYNHYIDHTLLKQDATIEQIKKLCKEAIEFGFASVCVNPYYVNTCKMLLENTKVKVCTVIGFPLGANSYKVKGFETKIAIEDGAEEVDMVINVGALKDKLDDIVLQDIKEVVKNAAGKIVKVIIETCLLTEEEKVRACNIAKSAGADFVKTSTGFSTGGATLEDVELMYKTVGDKLEVKASGGVKTFEIMAEMVKRGATRIGTSSGPLLVQNLKSNTNY